MSKRLLFVFRNNSYNADIVVKAETSSPPKSGARRASRPGAAALGLLRTEIAALEPVIAREGK
jgi:hypothetical protein